MSIFESDKERAHRLGQEEGAHGSPWNIAGRLAGRIVYGEPYMEGLRNGERNRPAPHDSEDDDADDESHDECEPGCSSASGRSSASTSGSGAGALGALVLVGVVVAAVVSGSRGGPPSASGSVRTPSHGVAQPPSAPDTDSTTTAVNVRGLAERSEPALTLAEVRRQEGIPTTVAEFAEPLGWRTIKKLIIEIPVAPSLSKWIAAPSDATRITLSESPGLGFQLRGASGSVYLLHANMPGDMPANELRRFRVNADPTHEGRSHYLIVTALRE